MTFQIYFTVQFGQNSLVGTAHSPGCLLVRIKLEPPEKGLHVLNHLPLCVYQRSGSIKKSPLSCNVLFHVATPQGEYVDHLPRVSSNGSTIEMKTSLPALLVGCCYRLNFTRSSTYCFLRELNWFIDLEFDFDPS
jgi:hypothetical protein